MIASSGLLASEETREATILTPYPYLDPGDVEEALRYAWAAAGISWRGRGSSSWFANCIVPSGRKANE
jgi:hypothetical protein